MFRPASSLLRRSKRHARKANDSGYQNLRTMFYNERLKLLLFLIADLNNVRMASDLMALSYGKAWSLLNSLEKNLGYAVVDRRQGGHQGGNTCLTERGLVFLYKNIE